CLGCEWRFQSDRAKLSGQWTWLRLRLSELDLQIQQVSKLHQHLHTNKTGVVLAEAQPLTDLQIQQTLLTETADLMLTARHPHDLNSELDTEPSSPTRLLRNIERQSAQLSQIVNSLMAPLSDSPLPCPVAKRDSRCWRGSRKRLFNSGETDVFLHTSPTCTRKAGEKKRRRVCCQGQLPSQVDVTPGCARTRPLLTYHKPRLFAMDQSAVTQQGADFSAYRFSRSVSCDQKSVCSGPDYSNSTNRSSAFFKQDWLQPSRPGSLLSPGLNPAGKHTPSIF
ncbi:KAT8 regulatory NSL complex subunit 1-like protein, partial [Clarias magur]